MKLSDEDLYTLAMALPRLKDLNFHFPLSTELPTLASLKHIAKFCPEVEYLGININIMRIIPAETERSS
jgi:hypothetical protein